MDLRKWVSSLPRPDAVAFGTAVATCALLAVSCGGSTSDDLFGEGSGASGGSGNASNGGSGNTSNGGSGNTSNGGSGNTSNGGSGNTSNGGSGNTGNTGNVPPFPCENPEPVYVLGQDTGAVRCANGMVHRVHARACPAESRSPVPVDFCGQVGDVGQCRSDYDCAERPLGYCRPTNGGMPMCGCVYGCVSDADCGNDQICRCGNPTGQCVPANCRDDGDCDGRFCAEYQAQPYCGGPVYACQTPTDACGGEGDCENNMPCTRDNMGPSYCTDEICAYASARPEAP